MVASKMQLHIVVVNVKKVAKQNKEKVEEAYKVVMKLEHIARREGLEDMEYMGAVRLREVDEAQRKIVQIAKTILG